MKTKSLFIAVLVVMSAFVTAVGKDEPRKAGLAVVAVKGSEVFKVIYRSENTGKVKLNIYNSESQLIFTEKLSADGFIRPLNFTGLQAGEYTVELVDATGKKVEKISYNPLGKSKKSIHISKILKEEGKYIVSIANAGSEKINVKIYDAANNLMHSEFKQIQGQFAQVYTIKNASGVTFEVTDNAGNTKTTRF